MSRWIASVRDRPDFSSASDWTARRPAQQLALQEVTYRLGDLPPLLSLPFLGLNLDEPFARQPLSGLGTLLLLLGDLPLLLFGVQCPLRSEQSPARPYDPAR